MRTFLFKSGLSAFLFLSIGTISQMAWSDVYSLPRTKAELDAFAHAENASLVDPMVRVEGARVAFFNRPALERDFPSVRGMSDSEMESWILRNCAYISRTQLQLNDVRQSRIPVVPRDAKDGFRPKGWNRAAVVPVFDRTGAKQVGLIDIKGSGLSHDSEELEEDLRNFRSWEESGNLAKIDQLRTMDHSDGLATLGEAIAEVVRAEALQKSFDRYNKTHGTNYQTIEHYFIISFPFQILKEKGRTDSAALIGRQAHRGRVHAGQAIPDELYVDFHGGKQSDLLGAAADMGGVFPTAPEFKKNFLTDLQITLLSKQMNLSDKKKAFDPQVSKEWVYAHETAKAFIQGESGKRVVYDHLMTMVGIREIAKERQDQPIYQRLEAMLEVSNPKVMAAVSSVLENYEMVNGNILFEKLINSSPEIGIQAASSLRKYKGKDAFLRFMAALSSSNINIREIAVSALKNYSGPDAQFLFEKALSDSSPEIRDRASHYQKERASADLP